MVRFSQPGCRTFGCTVRCIPGFFFRSIYLCGFDLDTFVFRCFSVTKVVQTRVVLVALQTTYIDLTSELNQLSMNCYKMEPQKQLNRGNLLPPRLTLVVVHYFSRIFL